ncbi:MAG: hypothetical protein PUD34_05950 [bacterium]|nr:hypothetical protein [bacterium]
MSVFKYENNQLSNVTCNYTNGETLTTDKVIIFYADSNLEFDPKKEFSLTDGNTVYKLRHTKDNKRLVFDTDSSNVKLDKDYTINGIIQAQTKEDIYAKRVYITATLTHCTCNYKNGEIVSKDKNIIVTADSGYCFNSNFDLQTTIGDNEFFHRTNDDTQLIYYVSNMEDSDTFNYNLNTDIVAEKITKQLNTFINVYRLSNEQLNSLSKEVVYNKDTHANINTFVNSIFILPIQLKDIDVLESDYIKMGNNTMNTKADVLENYRLLFDIGNISVKEEYQNAYDYIHTDCILHTPFFDTIRLDTEYVINQTIHIAYTVDLYSGICYIEISSTFHNAIFYQNSIKIVEDIPFLNKDRNSIVNQISTTFLNMISKAFIEIKRNKPYFSDDAFGKETIDVSTLTNKQGYIKIDNIELSTSATNDEKEKIVSLLKEGVFIK